MSTFKYEGLINGESNLTLPTIEVTEPKEHNVQGQGRYTSYLIVIDTEHPAFHVKSSAVRRRFSEVLWLHKVLRSIHKSIKIPKAPPRKITSERFDPDFIERRQEVIATFLNDVINTQTLISDSAVHLFLQSELSTKEIDAYFEGDLSQKRIDEIWAQGGLVNSSQKHNVQTSANLNVLSEISDQQEILSDCNSSATASPTLDSVEECASSEAKSSPLSNCSRSLSSCSGNSGGPLDSADCPHQDGRSFGASQIPANTSAHPNGGGGISISTVADVHDSK